MKIYLDVLFGINFFFDFLLLLIVSILLKRNIKVRRLLLGAFIGGLSIFLLFIKVNSIQLFLLKFFISIIMIISTFSFKNLNYTLKNISYLYLVSIILGGALYFINIQFSYKQEGLVFYHNGLSPNIIVIMILSPFILWYYLSQHKLLKQNYSLHYKVDIYLKDHTKLKLNGFLDTGNQLFDPYLHRPIIMINKGILKNSMLKEYILVEASTINHKSFIKCIEIDKVCIEGVGEFKNILLGIMNRAFHMEGIDCILHHKLWEE